MRALEGCLGIINKDKDIEALDSGTGPCIWEMAQMSALG